MRIDPRYTEKINTLKDFFREGGIIHSLEQIRSLFSYANRMSAKLFLERLVRDDFLRKEGKHYFPTAKFTGYPLHESVRAGFPFTPQDEPRQKIDIDDYLIAHPAATYLVRVKGDSMMNAGIIEDDIVVVDRSLPANNGDIVIASIEGDVNIKYYEKRGERVSLIPANPAYKPLLAPAGTELLGVVVGVIRKYGR
jgi:SOS regulatory protein LexA